MVYDDDIFWLIHEGTKGKEQKFLDYFSWLLSLSVEHREAHYRSADDLVALVRFGYDSRKHELTGGPECPCEICAGLYSEACRKVQQHIAEQSREKKSPKLCRETYIYVIKNHRNGYTKIGRSKTPYQREATLQAQEPEISLLFFFIASEELERDLHREFDEVRVRGEWFDLSNEQIGLIHDRYGVTVA